MGGEDTNRFPRELGLPVIVCVSLEPAGGAACFGTDARFPRSVTTDEFRCDFFCAEGLPSSDVPAAGLCLDKRGMVSGMHVYANSAHLESKGGY